MRASTVVYTKNYNAAFREGGGVAIAALARASMLDQLTGSGMANSPARSISRMPRGPSHTCKQHNPKYCDNGVENIIDDYTALLAATELYRATQQRCLSHRPRDCVPKISTSG